MKKHSVMACADRAAFELLKESFNRDTEVPRLTLGPRRID